MTWHQWPRRKRERQGHLGTATPAGRITDGQKNRFAFFSSLRECLFAPGVPVDRVVCVLQKVGRLFVGQSFVAVMAVFLVTPLSVPAEAKDAFGESPRYTNHLIIALNSSFLIGKRPIKPNYSPAAPGRNKNFLF